MGYFVSGSGEFTIPASNIKAAYEAVVALNDVPNAAKHGGTWSAGKEESRHFSWLPTDLRTIPTLQEIFTEMGFEVWDNETDGLTIHNFPNNKSGQEELFAAAVAPFVNSGGYFIWDGEDGEYWKWVFNNSEMSVHEGVREYDPIGKSLTVLGYVYRETQRDAEFKKWMQSQEAVRSAT
jgi:hypothetical protein